MVTRRHLCLAGGAGLFSLGYSLSNAQDASHPFQRFFDKLHNSAEEDASRVNQAALRVYDNARQPHNCSAEHEAFLKQQPRFLKLCSYTRDIYVDGADLRMQEAKVDELDLGSGRHAFRHRGFGKRYAEMRVDDGLRRVEVVFRGTRGEVRGDVLTDVGNQLGATTEYYEWASELVKLATRQYSGYTVTATGHSLGGGLALYSALRNPHVDAVSFNSAGLSLKTWDDISIDERHDINERATVIATRNDQLIDPITAVSMAGHSVLPGRLYVLHSTEKERAKLHGVDAVMKALDVFPDDKSTRKSCAWDLGVPMSG